MYTKFIYMYHVLKIYFKQSSLWMCLVGHLHFSAKCLDQQIFQLAAVTEPKVLRYHTLPFEHLLLQPEIESSDVLQ